MNNSHLVFDITFLLSQWGIDARTGLGMSRGYGMSPAAGMVQQSGSDCVLIAQRELEEINTAVELLRMRSEDGFDLVKAKYACNERMADIARNRHLSTATAYKQLADAEGVVTGIIIGLRHR